MENMQEKRSRKGKAVYSVEKVSKQINLSRWKFVSLARSGCFDFVKAEFDKGMWKYYFDPLKTAQYLKEYKKIMDGA